MDTVIKNYLEQLKIGRKQSYKNLALYPLLSTCSLGLEYLLLDEALNKNLIEIVEKNRGGSVPELRVMNKSPKMILILDGEELVGAKQNRIVNTTILVKGNATIVIPVSCVEHGRWSYDTPQFHSKKRMMSSNLRAMKSEQVNYSIKSSGEFRSDQSAIWDGIAEKLEYFRITSCWQRVEKAAPHGSGVRQKKWMQTVFSHIIQKRFSWVNEDVATDALAYKRGAGSNQLIEIK